MGTKYSRQTIYRTQKKGSKGGLGTAVAAFFITLAVVVLTGSAIVVSLALPKYLRLHRNEPVSIVTFVEAIPETLSTEEVVEDPEVLGANAVKERYADILKDKEYLKQNRIYPKTAASKDVVTLGFVGDILFDDGTTIIIRFFLFFA